MKRFPSLTHQTRPQQQRGAGSLIVVLVLFFVLSLVAAYSSRNMIFEQKVSANQYRSVQSFESSQGGLEWALALLNTGNIDASCNPSAGNDSFRNRFLNINATTGVITVKMWVNAAAVSAALNAQCVRGALGWTCSCPNNGLPVLAAPPPGDPAPAFRARFSTDNTGGRPGVIGIRVQACTRLDDLCLSDTGSSQIGVGDAISVVTSLVALKGAISTPPQAALTAGGSIDLGGAAVQVTNTEALVNGLTLNARNGINNTAAAVLTSVPGAAPGASTAANDNNVPATADLLFASVFGMKRSSYQQQPAAIRLTCPADCGAVNLRALAAANPGRVLWVEGDIDLDDPGDIGSAASPVAMVVHGNLTASVGGVRIFGLVYIYNGGGQWVTGGSPVIQGAVISEGNVSGVGTPQITYDFGILKRLRLFSGSFVRVPGSWQEERT